MSDEHQEHQPEGQQDAGDGSGGLRVLHREDDQAEDRDVLEQADADVGDRLGGGVDRQPDAGLHQVAGQGGPAADRGQHDLVERASAGTSPASSAPMIAPAVGRMKVEIASHVESM